MQIGTTGANKAGEVKNAKVTAFNDNTAAAMELKNAGIKASKPIEEISTL